MMHEHWPNLSPCCLTLESPASSFVMTALNVRNRRDPPLFASTRRYCIVFTSSNQQINQPSDLTIVHRVVSCLVSSFDVSTALCLEPNSTSASLRLVSFRSVPFLSHSLALISLICRLSPITAPRSADSRWIRRNTPMTHGGHPRPLAVDQARPRLQPAPPRMHPRARTRRQHPSRTRTSARPRSRRTPQPPPERRTSRSKRSGSTTRRRGPRRLARVWIGTWACRPLSCRSARPCAGRRSAPRRRLRAPPRLGRAARGRRLYPPLPAANVL